MNAVSHCDGSSKRLTTVLARKRCEKIKVAAQRRPLSLCTNPRTHYLAPTRPDIALRSNTPTHSSSNQVIFTMLSVKIQTTVLAYIVAFAAISGAASDAQLKTGLEL